MGDGERGTLKKLTAAAQYWVRPAPKPKAQALEFDEEFADMLRKVKVSAADIEAQQVAQSSELLEADFEVHEDAWESWLFFLKVCRQWRYVAVSAGMGMTSVRHALDWCGIESVIRLSGIKRSRWAGLLDDLLVIEEAVLVADAGG